MSQSFSVQKSVGQKRKKVRVVENFVRGGGRPDDGACSRAIGQLTMQSWGLFFYTLSMAL